MKLLHSLPLLLLVALACHGAPVRAQDTGIVETTLPGADDGASLQTLAAQAPTLTPAAQRTGMPLRLFHGQPADRPRSKRWRAAPRRTARCKVARHRRPWPR